MFSPDLGQRLRLISRDDIAREFEAFLVDCRARDLSQRTIRLYTEKFRLWQELFRLSNVADVASITPHHIRLGLVNLAQSHNPGGVHVAYRVLKTFLRWLVAEGVLNKNPIERIKPPRLHPEPIEPVPVSDVAAMVATCKPRSFIGDRDRAILLALLDTGCRAAEFLALNLGDINLSTGTVVVRQGKGGKFRTVFVGAKSRRVIIRYLRHRGELSGDAPLWVSDERTRLTYQGLRKMVVRRAELAGVPAPALHDFRRAFCLACLRNGVDLISLQRLMGHSDLSVIRRYLAQVESDLQQAHAKGGPVDRLL